jgi:hypothetical protein
VPVTIEFQGVPETELPGLQSLFNSPEERVAFSHSFGGSDLVNLLTTLSRSTLEKLISCWPRLKASARKTTFKIDKFSVTLTGFTAEEINAFLASPQFAKAIRGVKNK